MSKSRIEALLEALINDTDPPQKPMSRVEAYLHILCDKHDELSEEIEDLKQNGSGTGNVGTDFGGVEITDGDPTKETTVMTLNPNAPEVNLYTAEEIDAMFDALVNGNEVAY